MKFINGILITKNRGPVPVIPENLAVINLVPDAYLQNFDMAVKQGTDITGYMFLLEKEGKNDS